MLGFAPDGGRAAQLDRMMREGLADSLATIFESFAPHGDSDGRLTALLGRIRSGPVAPGVFGIYVELVLALFGGRDEEAAGLADTLLCRDPRPSAKWAIVTLDDRDLGAGQADRYRRLLREDIGGDIVPLGTGAFAGAVRRLEHALDLLRDAAPDLLEEIRALVRQIVLVAPEADTAARPFAGASVFSLWGCLTLNGEAFASRVEVAITLVHEAAHLLLFGLAGGGRLTENDPDDGHRSPLRDDLRPMEGVFHATYVTARMIHALDLLIGSGALDADERRHAAALLIESEAAYRRGIDTVSTEARFTTSGAMALAAMRDFMAARSRRAVPA